MMKFRNTFQIQEANFYEICNNKQDEFRRYCEEVPQISPDMEYHCNGILQQSRHGFLPNRSS